MQALRIERYRSDGLKIDKYKLVINSIWMVSRSVSIGSNGEIMVGNPKTDNGIRTILLPDKTADILDKRLVNSFCEWIFPNLQHIEKPTNPVTAYNNLKHILKKAGLPQIRFHDLCHTFATYAQANGVDIKTLQEMLGHASVKMTLDVYSHVTDKMRKNAADTINRAIGKADDNENTRNIVVKDADKKSKPFEPYKGKIRKRGTGCISKISDNTWEGRYSPRLPGGKRDQHVIYAHSEEECEKLLAEMIEQVKAGKTVK